jgi:hypothetical protein
MTEEQIALARRAVACKGWRWMPGMRVLLAPDIVGRVLDNGSVVYDGTPGYRIAVGELPDLTDPATLGCLLARVREAWGAPRALVRLSANGKSFHVFDVDRVTMGGNWAAFLCGDRNHRTEAHALVAALEAAP